jgi:hypothetical protein
MGFHSFHWFLRIFIEFSEIHWRSIVSIGFYRFTLNSFDFYCILFLSLIFIDFYWIHARLKGKRPKSFQF